ncbi:organic cation/carnitine transporter 2-like [Amphiura filiformis]|uniref:organic cation/carnitine transporter 2-like n=1 Tax=Amphiura filiformis TaxID=82378 RepID=UPI003B221DBB
MELDEAFRFIGSKGPLKVGWYHILLYALLVFYNCWIIGFQLMGMIFIGHVPKNYQCTPPDGFFTNDTTPVLDETTELDKCHMYEVQDGIVTQNITECLYGWDYERIIGETSIVTDFNLVCGDAIYAKIAQSVFMVGVLAGSVTSGQISDFFGRKIVLHIALVLKAVSGVIMALLWDYNALVASWFFVGVFNQAIQISSYVMMTEMFPPEIRTISTPLVSLIWGLAVSSVVPIALLFPNWRHYQIFISVICLIGVPLWWLTPESARWLISRGQIEEAEEILKKMAKFNGIKIPNSFLSDDKEIPLNEDIIEPSNKGHDGENEGEVHQQYYLLRAVTK